MCSSKANAWWTHTWNPELDAQSKATGTGWSLAAECSAGICQPPTASGLAVPASANAVQDAATPHAIRTTVTARTGQPSAWTTARARSDLMPPADTSPRRPGASPSRPNSATAIPPMNMTCTIDRSGATW